MKHILLDIIFVVGVAFIIHDMRLDLEVLTHEVVHQRQQVKDMEYKLHSLEGETRYLATDVSLLTTYCEVVADITMSTARTGWWNQSVATQLRKLASIKRLREENNEWRTR